MRIMFVKVLLSLRKKNVTNTMVNAEIKISTRNEVTELNASVKRLKLKSDLSLSRSITSRVISLSIVGNSSCSFTFH